MVIFKAIFINEMSSLMDRRVDNQLRSTNCRSHKVAVENGVIMAHNTVLFVK